MDTLELATIVNKYCELCPDLYAKDHYERIFKDDPSKRWNPLVGWQWLADRLNQDRLELVNLDGSTGCQGFWWESWKND